jgi:glycosyltransferase 2 family protein
VSENSTGFMKSKFEYIWPFIGLAAVAFSLYLLAQKLEGVRLADIWQAVVDRGLIIFILCIASTLLAYAALAWYDRIALMHVGKTLSWPVVSLVSFTAYALGHNIGVSVLSSGVVRYRAYSRMGLTVGEVAIVTAFCAFTFGYGAMLLGGIVLAGEPAYVAEVLGRTSQEIAHQPLNFPTWAVVPIGLGMLGFVGLYQAGAALHLKPLKLGGLAIAYPKPGIAFRQLFAAPLEIIGASAIIYFALPDSLNPGFFAVLGIFLASFSAGIVAQAPGGLGVFEGFFLAAILPAGTLGSLDPAATLMKAQVLAALLMFRLLYLIIPLALSCVVVLHFERTALMNAVRAALGWQPGGPAPIPVEVKSDPPRD